MGSRGSGSHSQHLRKLLISPDTLKPIASFADGFFKRLFAGMVIHTLAPMEW
jgi:hypothetical protein